ncbi:MAG: trypsin-like peptidase domain-containing protein [Ilumatobacteraceae bacterium]
MARISAVVAAAGLVMTACAADPPSGVVGLVIDSCDPGEGHGSGMLIAPDVALTSAHVLAGARRIEVIQGGRTVDGTVIAFDPEMDLAYVTFDAVPDRPITVESDHVDPGDRGTAYVVRHGEVVEVPVRITRRVRLRTEDIYVQGETLRPGFELEAAIEPGDSGGAVVVDGAVVGVLWARSNQASRRAYAIDAELGADRIERQRATGTIDAGIDITRCH